MVLGLELESSSTSTFNDFLAVVFLDFNLGAPFSNKGTIIGTSGSFLRDHLLTGSFNS